MAPTALPTAQGNKIAQTYNLPSKRRNRDAVEKKTVFKSVLDNPFQVKWPIVPLNIQNSILARMLELLRDTEEYNAEKSRLVHSRKRKRRKEVKTKLRKETQEDAFERRYMPFLGVPMFRKLRRKLRDKTHMDSSVELNKFESVKTLLSVPHILERLVIGINEVTKRLEEQSKPCVPISIYPEKPQDVMETTDEQMENEEGSVRAKKHGSTPITPLENQPRRPLRAILVCKSDVDPPLLIQHFPYLVAACNVQLRGTNEVVKLVTLPQGSESTLSAALRLRRTAVIGLDSQLTTDQILEPLLSSVPTIAAPWLIGNPVQKRKADAREFSGSLSRPLGLIPTHIKQLRTTAPKDMRAAKTVRAKERSEAKVEKQEKKMRAAKAIRNKRAFRTKGKKDAKR